MTQAEAKQLCEELGVDFDRMEFEHYMQDSFTARQCNTTRQAIMWKFPKISNLDVFMNEEGNIVIVFDELPEGPTQKEVTDFLQELRKSGTNIAVK